MDALSVLRDYAMRQDMGNVHQVGDEFLFGDDYRFPCSTETGYRSKGGILYTLDSLVFFVKSRDLKHTEYLQQARALKLQIVTYIDRKPLLDYLEGRVSTCDQIELLPPSTIETHASPRLDIADDTSRKRGRELEREDDPSLLIELVRSLERPVRDRETILLCPNKSFDNILSLFSDKRKVEQHQPQPRPVDNSKFVKVEAASDVKTSSSMDKRIPAPVPVRSSKNKIEGPPIILVPNASQTLLNTYNAKEFLEDGVYVQPDVKSKTVAKKPETVMIYRKIGREIPVKYEIRDKPSSLASKDWERVVAVFVLGKEWQFKDWPFKDHVEIFNKILGVYLRFEDDSMESVKVVMQWNVKIISLSKHKRHQDRTAVLEFWDKLDAFLRARRVPIVF